MTRGGGSDAGEDHVRVRGSAQRDAVGHISEGARRLGVTEAVIRQRIEGALPKGNGEDGRVYAYRKM